MWEVSGQDIDFVSTMACENGTFEAERIHPKNKNGTRDYSFGLNSRYHWPMIQKILNKEVSYKEMVEYHLAIYKQRHGAFYGYYKRNKCKAMFIIN